MIAGAAAVIAALAALAPAPGAISARAAFEAGHPETAAVLFEEAWERGGRPIAGVNAVVSWRTAGRYARARALAARVRPAIPPGSELHGLLSLLEARLGELTGTIALAGDAADAAVLVDGSAPERAGDALIVGVGRRTLRIARDGCTPLVIEVTVAPAQRVTVRETLDCPRQPGGLHVTLRGAEGARAYVDETRHDVPVFDLDLRLAPGEYALALERRGTRFASGSFEVKPGETTRVDARVPWRARDPGLRLGASAAAAGGTHASPAAVGVEVQLQSSKDFRRAIGLVSGAIRLAHSAGLEAAGPWVHITGGVARVFPPLWRGQLAGSDASLDLDLLLSIGLRQAHRGPLTETQGAAGMVPVVLTVELPADLHLEARLYLAAASFYEPPTDALSSRERASWGPWLEATVGIGVF